MERFDGPAREVTVLVIAAIVGLLGLLLTGLLQFFGTVGVAVFFGLVLFVVLVAVVAGLSLEAAFAVFAYAVGFTRSAILRLG